MEGKRVIQPDTGEETKKRLPLAGIIAAVLVALLLGAALGLCPVSYTHLLSKPSTRLPPPVMTMPLVDTSATSSGGVRSRTE